MPINLNLNQSTKASKYFSSVREPTAWLNTKTPYVLYLYKKKTIKKALQTVFACRLHSF
jgi:hypothetical protein